MFLFLFLILFSNLIFPFKIKIIKEKELLNCSEIGQFAALNYEYFALGDNDCHCINFYNKDLNWIKKFGRLSKMDEGFEYFWALSFDEKELLYVSSHIKNVSIFDKNGSFIGFIDTNNSAIRKIIPVDDILILGSSKFPQIKIYKDKKFLKEFGNYPEENKKYPTGAFIPMDAEKDRIYFSTVLNYPIYVYDYDGNIMKKIGNQKLIRKPYYTLKEEEKIDFKKFSAIIDLFLYKDFLITIQIMPKESEKHYSWDIFNKNNGNTIIQGYETDCYILSVLNEILILEEYGKQCEIFFVKIIIE